MMADVDNMGAGRLLAESPAVDRGPAAQQQGGAKQRADDRAVLAAIAYRVSARADPCGPGTVKYVVTSVDGAEPRSLLFRPDYRYFLVRDVAAIPDSSITDLVDAARSLVAAGNSLQICVHCAQGRLKVDAAIQILKARPQGSSALAFL
ncbi:hypothetical protein [Polymorphospora rubra]|uniref:hypothetical protein n=1 Tax=Polymorphospora rubra TaxID=338584 RepID=UPI0033EA67C0